jgi:geranylgeranyl pyrophosphate synthase
VEGKLFRPILNLLLSKMLYDVDENNKNHDFFEQVKLLKINEKKLKIFLVLE